MSWFVRKEAEVSPDGLYRWWLRRTWPDGNGKVVCFVMLNPSTADAELDDPTIRRCMGFARHWGFSTLSVRNLFPYRATDPSELSRAQEPGGGARGMTELLTGCTAHVTVAAWGAHPLAMGRAAAFLFCMQRHYPGKDLLCLGMTKQGHPRHPLYVKKDTPLVLYPFQGATP